MARKKKTPDAQDKTDTSVSEPDQTTDTDAVLDDADQPVVADTATTPEDDVSVDDVATGEDVADKATENLEAGSENPSDPAPVSEPEADQVSQTVEPPVPPVVVDDHVGEHGSFPTWVKVFIIMIFGALLALWAGPRVANNLPDGMAPVARFLAPGSVRQAREINARLSLLESATPTALDPSDIRTAVNDALNVSLEPAIRVAIAENGASANAGLDDLRDAIAAIGAADLGARLAAAETRIEGLDAQISSLASQVTESIAAGLAEQGQMTAEQAATYQANIDRLKAEIGQIASLQGAIDHKIDGLAATNARLSEEAAEIAERAEVQTREIANAAQIGTALKDIEAALETGAGFRAALDVLAGATGDLDLTALSAVADQGAAPLTRLQSDFPSLAYDALRASMRDNADGYVGSALSFVKSNFATRSLEPISGTGTNPVLSRMDAALGAGDFATVLSEAQGLNDAARAPLAGWLTEVATLAAAQTSFAEVSARFSSL